MNFYFCEFPKCLLTWEAAQCIGSLCVDQVHYQISIYIGVMPTGSKGQPFLVLALHLPNLYIRLQQVFNILITCVLFLSFTNHQLIALLNLSVLGSSFVVFHDKTKRTQQGNLLIIHSNYVSRVPKTTAPKPKCLQHLIPSMMVG